MKLIRTVHLVKINMSGYTTAKAIKKDLANVPDAALLVDEDEDHGQTVLVFREEEPTEECQA